MSRRGSRFTTKLFTVILSLAVASSVIAAPTPGPNASELEKRSWLGDKITEWFQEVKDSFNAQLA
ncbi:hypothetical protein BGZ47_006806, partial [Haplosporangium gracile]